MIIVSLLLPDCIQFKLFAIIFCHNEILLQLGESECDYLTKEAIHQLSRTGLEIKRKFGVELDIEWALKGSELFILQCRPITN